jgi:hypothetical protein
MASTWCCCSTLTKSEINSQAKDGQTEMEVCCAATCDELEICPRDYRKRISGLETLHLTLHHNRLGLASITQVQLALPKIMSHQGYTGPTCPVCTLSAIKKLGPSPSTSATSTINMDELDWDVINTLIPKCTLCKLLVDLRAHWYSDQADEQMSDDGETYQRMCENGNWWPPFFPRRTLYTLFVDFGQS